MRFSLSTIITCVFAAFLIHSVYNLYLLYSPPSCNSKDICYKSYLNAQPKLELLVYLSDSLKTSGFQQILHEPDFNYNQLFQRNLEIQVPKAAHLNQSIFIHTMVIPRRRKQAAISLQEAESLHDSTYVKSKLTKHIVPVRVAFNLLGKEHQYSNQERRAVTHLKTKYAIVMCDEEMGIPHSGVPLELLKYLRINSKKQFLPIVMHDILQSRLKDLEEVTRDKTKMNFTYIYQPISIGKFKFLVQMENTFMNFMQMGFTAKDVDEVKGVFIDTNFYLLSATMTIGSIHLLFDFLSFKNDVSFWRSHKSMAGLSSRTVLWRCFSQTIVFLFLLEEGTSLLVLIPCSIGMLIEYWKVTKVFKLRIGLRGIQIDKTHKETEAEKTTRKYDQESMKYLNYLLYPLLICSAVYSLMYQPHKSWYSWTINSMVNGVYAFGFIFMLPQLFVNYRLKSVAALPWRAFTYRAFNTFIDDIFAFIITMPTAHRIACFRDDVVFIVYLYQRWLYPVDKTRVDDGSGEADDEVALKKLTGEGKKDQ